MKKNEFISELKKELKSLSKDDQKEIIEDYKLHIEEKIEAGKKESEIIKKLGDAKGIAREHILELKATKEIIITPKRIGLFISMQILNFLVVFWLIFSLGSVLFSFFISAITVFFSAFLIFVLDNPFSIFMEIAYFLGSIGASILLFNLAIVLSEKGYKLIKKYFLWNKKLLRGEK